MIEILGHGRGWAYDGWLVKYFWSDSTFMHHAMKNPPIGGENNGRIMPMRSVRDCPPFPDRTRDFYYASEQVLAEMLEQARCGFACDVCRL